jgi:hypothetical protein
VETDTVRWYCGEEPESCAAAFGMQTEETRTRTNKHDVFAAVCDMPGVTVCKMVAVKRHYGREK